MSLEINGAGHRKPIAEAYPSRELLELAFELKIPITFGNDAHSPEQVGLFSSEIHSLAKEVGYTECCYYKEKKQIICDF